MTTLSNTARLILRSRVRRHKDADALLGGKTVSGITNADLIQFSMIMGLTIPTEHECAVYDNAKAAGVSGKGAILQADGLAPIGQGMSARPADDLDDCAQDDADHQDDAPAPETSTADADADADKRKAQATAKASYIRGLMGTGDFEGFTRELQTLAETAFRPDPAPVVKLVHAQDASKVKGVIPKTVSRKSLADVGVKVSGKVRDDATAMWVYDAQDAPAIDSGYIWPDASGSIVATLAHGDNVFLYGPAGTGKTTFAEQVAARWGRPFVRISCDDQTEAATLTGMTVPSRDGGVTWQDGQLTAAIRRAGTVVLIDEPSVARAGALFVLQAVLDGGNALHLGETGDVVHVAEGVIFILADNTNGTGDETGQYEATRRLNRAFLDRASATYRLDYLTPQQEAKALTQRTGIKRSTADALAKFAAMTRAKADEAALSHGIGFRRLTALAKQLTYGVDPHAAFQHTVLETAPYDDREPLRQIWSAEIDPKTLA